MLAGMTRLTALLALFATLVVAAGSGCGTFKGGFDNINPPPVHEGRGCYDPKGRIDRTITTQAECNTLAWVWRPE